VESTTCFNLVMYEVNPVTDLVIEKKNNDTFIAK
jgi:hypothetical protein